MPSSKATAQPASARAASSSSSKASPATKEAANQEAQSTRRIQRAPTRGLLSLVAAVLLSTFTDSIDIGEDSRWICMVVSLILGALMAWSPFVQELPELLQLGQSALKKKKKQLAGLLLMLLGLVFKFGIFGPAGALTVFCFGVACYSLYSPKRPRSPPVAASQTDKAAGTADLAATAGSAAKAKAA